MMLKKLTLTLFTLFVSLVALSAPEDRLWPYGSLTQCNNGVTEIWGPGSCPSGWSAGPISDNQAPTITLNGASTVTYTEGNTYTELGATCSDTEDGSITVPAPSFSPTLNMAAAGTYIATYTCTDSGSLTDQVNRTVNVNSAPVNGQLAFTNASSAISGGTSIPQVFWAGMPDVNGDGCLDLYIGAHEDVVNSNMLIQDNVAGVCQGTFTYFADNDNYSQGTDGQPDEYPRITSRYLWGNWYGHPQGFWSYLGQDVEGDYSARYVVDPAFTTVGGQPQYLSKSNGCWGSRPKCLPIDVDGDGDFEIATRLFDAPYNTGYILNADNGNVMYPSNVQNGQLVGHLSVFDVDNDGEPEVVNAYLDGYFEFDSVNSEMDFVGSKFTGTTHGLYATGNHILPFDYDNDGDLDLYAAEGEYNQNGNGLFDIYFFENDGAGNFTNVTSTAFAGIAFYNQAYHTTYGNSQIADVDLDGDLDLIMCSEEFDDTVVFILNDGDGTFTRHGDIDMTPTNFGADSRRPWCQVADYDNDGLPDVVHNGERTGASGQLYRNTTSTTNHWIQIRVRGSGDNTDGVHSRVTVFEAGTTNILTYQQIGVFSSGYQNMRVHTGTAAHTLVDVRVEYPHGGPTCNFSNIAVDQNYVAFPTCNLQQYTPGSAIPLTYVATNDVNTTVELVADSAVTPTATELVTFGLPFNRGEVTNLNEIKVSIGGSEVAAYVEEGLTWWADNSIRSATIQLQNVDMTGGNVTVAIDDTGFSVARLTKQPVLNGWADIVGATKDNHLSPRILPKHDPQYLADSGLIPPYAPDPVTPDAYELYREDMFDDWQGTPLNYSSTSGSNWLFDKASAHFKGYMASGETKYLAEAARAKRFYFTHVRNDGTAPQQSGGDGCWTYGGTACADGKYIYPQPAKLALALLGDDSQWDDSLINEMAQQAQLGWNQWWFNFPYTQENEGYTERSHGIIGLAIANAYEITGSATIKTDLVNAVDYTRDMQQTVFSFDTANGWGNIGCFRHAWSVHEGDTYPGDGTADDRRCSPWMSENIADFLWQTYWATTDAELSNRSDIGEILRRLGEAVESYAYNTSSLQPSAPQVGIQEACGAGCTTMAFCTNGNTPVPFYSMSDVASTAALQTTVINNGRTDTHVPEMVLIHAAARYFETNATIEAAHDARIARIDPDYYTIACADWYPGTGTQRLYQWQLRSNAQRTWDWAEVN